MPEFLFAEAFVLGGSPTTWLEIAAVAISLLMVWCNIREIHWGWPLAMVASGLYFAIFWRSLLYGEAGLQVVFIVVAAWGWRQWLRGGAGELHVTRLSPRGRALALAACAALWPLTALFLDRLTDSDVPWWDAFPTALSLVAQYLLGRKILENWTGWAVVNLASVALFLHKGLWLTVALYTVFIVLSVAGWRAWRRQLP
ncbi:nicotinamide riboside transporter PnuC [Ramlibacter sp. MAHUQ-53]|uniref:nicotinamide riboside transporter PnuC n=1 Tax=unclassified Ramlibacter TaxID=2617605 RepID=UPI0036373712